MGPGFEVLAPVNRPFRYALTFSIRNDIMGQARLLYSSENGDRWYLVRDPDSDRVFVRHEPNAASGGLASEIEISDFLIHKRRSPEHIELLRLIGSLVVD